MNNLTRNQFFILPLTILSGFLSSGEATAQEEPQTLTISAYTDVYYSYFTNETGANELQPFTTVSPRNKRFGLNVAQIGLGYDSKNVRGNITLHWGDIPKATWSQEFLNVQEANAGIRLAGDFWLDAGFFTTHIGTESFLPKNNFLSSTAVATYNEPFYQAGARLTYEGSEDFYAELWVLNGYNRFLDTNDAKSFGLLFQYNFSPVTSITYTNLLGNETISEADSKRFRSYHNLYLNTSFNNRIFLTVGGDYATQTNSRFPDLLGSAVLYNALATIRYQFTEKFSITGRGEIFKDEYGFITGLVPNRDNEFEGLDLWGATLGSEYRPAPNAYLRAEARYLNLQENLVLFLGDFSPYQRWEFMITMGYQLDKVFNL